MWPRRLRRRLRRRRLLRRRRFVRLAAPVLLRLAAAAGAACGDACATIAARHCCAPRSRFWSRRVPPVDRKGRAEPSPGDDQSTPAAQIPISARRDVHPIAATAGLQLRSGGRFTLGFGLPCLGDWGFETTYFPGRPQRRRQRQLQRQLQRWPAVHRGQPAVHRHPTRNGPSWLPWRRRRRPGERQYQQRAVGRGGQLRHPLCVRLQLHLDFLGAPLLAAG